MKAAPYVVISPVRNEEEYLGCTLQSMVAQTITPQQWIIVDDGSSDHTARIAEEVARDYPWMQVIRRSDRGSRKPGTGVVEAFYDGYRQLDSRPWDFLVKLDGDLSFAPDFFERSFHRFVHDPKLGIGGGMVCALAGDRLVSESPADPAFHVRGATKIYRRECWDTLGGLMPAPGWDTIDEYKANMLGWATYTFPEIKLRHHRTAGAAQGTWKNWVKNGLANYVAGYHPLFMSCKCVRRAFTKPYGIAAAGLMVGFVGGYLRRTSQVDDRALIRYVRDQQLRKLSFRDSVWDRRRVQHFQRAV